MGLTLLIFLTVSLGITAGFHILSDLLFPEAARIRQRVSQEFGTEDPGKVSSSPLFKNLDQFVQEVSNSGAGEKARPAGRTLWSGLQNALEQANLKLSAGQVCKIALAIGLACAAAGWWLGGPIFAVAGAVGGAVTPFAEVRRRQKARLNLFQNQLPAAFELMSRIIRAGQSVTQALLAVADAFEDPISTEFSKCQNQLNLGLSPEVTFREMAQRSGILEIRIFVMALLIQTQAGGSLAEVLERLAGLIRARLRLKKQIRTLTAEGRLQGWTLVVLPFVVFGVMMIINRAYAEVLLEHFELVAATIGSILLGMLWIRKIVNFEF